MSHTWLRTVSCAALAAALICPVAATGQNRPMPQQTLSRGSHAATRGTNVKIGPHTRFGTITRLQANAFVMRTRAGRVLTVDDTVPLQAGTYSFPLFVGKRVMVTGDIDANGVMHANTITRLPDLEPQTPADH